MSAAISAESYSNKRELRQTHERTIELLGQAIRALWPGTVHLRICDPSAVRSGRVTVG